MTVTILTNEEIDALVAEKVMGWRYERVDSGGNGYFSRWYDAEGNRLYSNMVTETSVWGIRWQPSISIAQAWQVVDKFDKGGDDVWVQTDTVGWLCMIASDNNKDYVGRADTAPRAICVAALATHGIKINISGEAE